MSPTGGLSFQRGRGMVGEGCGDDWDWMRSTLLVLAPNAGSRDAAWGVPSGVTLALAGPRPFRAQAPTLCRRGGESRVEVLADRVTWHPAGAREPLAIDVASYFDRVLVA